MLTWIWFLIYLVLDSGSKLVHLSVDHHKTVNCYQGSGNIADWKGSIN